MFIINGGDTCCTCELSLQPQQQPVVELTKFVDKRPFPIPEPAIDRTKKVALITGASKGIGLVISERLAQRGYDLALVARSVGPLEETATLCRKYGVRVCVIPADLGDMTQLENAVKTCVQQLGNIKVLVNNAGVNRRRSTLSAGSSVWDSIIDTNFRAAIQITRACLPYMAQNDPTEGQLAVMYISSSGRCFSLQQLS
jgi:short-subunit dehydrogenase